MSKFQNIIEGWGKSTGLLSVTPENMKLSIARMEVCAGCPFAKKSSFLAILKGKGHQMSAIACDKCGCPVNEKSLSVNETCPLGKWADIK